MTWGPMVISTPSSPILSFWRPWEWLTTEPRRSQDTAKTFKRISGGFIPSSWERPLCPSYSMSCCAWRFLLCKTLWPISWDSVWFQRDSTFPGSFRDWKIFVRLPFEISRSNWLESSPSSCSLNLPMIFISMYSYSLSLSF